LSNRKQYIRNSLFFIIVGVFLNSKEEKNSKNKKITNDDKLDNKSNSSAEDTKLHDSSYILPPQTIQNKCWNCNSEITNNDWCNNCRVPLRSETREKILARTSPAKSVKCWRCGGTTSGDVCGICGSPLTATGVKDILDSVKITTPSEQEEPEFIFILSPKDRQLVRISVKYSEIEALVQKYFSIDRSVLTNYGPEMIIHQPEKSEVYKEFEAEELLIHNNLRTLFKEIKLPTGEAKYVAMRFFYWKPEETDNRFTFKNIRWKLLFLAVTIVTVILTGWLYTREVYSIFSIEKSMVLDISLFSIAVLSITIVHELGHFLIQRLKKINLSLPYFLPIPPIPGFMSYFMLGTAGGFIRVIDPVQKRNDLFDLYFFGPIFGLILSIGFLLIGSAFPYINNLTDLSTESLERLQLIQQFDPVMLIGMFFTWFTDITNIAPSFDPTSQALFNHPLTYAGLVGIILNGLNFLPGSILDGGFMFRSLFGERLTRAFSFLSALILMFNYNTWALGVLTMFIPLNLYQTPITNEALGLHWSRYILEALALGIAVICIPIPAFFFGS